MTAYHTRPLHLYQHPTDVLNDVMVALNEAVRNYKLPMSFGLKCEPVIIQGGPPAEPAISLVCYYEGDDFNEPLPDRACNVTEGECESCQ